MPSISRSNLAGIGAPKVTFNGHTFWTRDDVMVPLVHDLVEQRSAMYGRVTKTRKGRKIEINLPLYGFWTNLSDLFPSYILEPTPQRIFGTSDLTLVLLAKNGDKLTIKNARVTGIANLKLAANAQIFSGMVKFTGLIANNASPTDANAYYQFQTGQAYAEGDFPQTPFKSLTWTGAWGSRTGFTSILTQEGWTLDWEIGMQEDVVDGIGPVDMIIQTFWGKASAIPVGPTAAQIDAGVDFQSTYGAVGADIQTDSDDLVLTDGTSTLTLTKAAMVQTGYVFSPTKKRIGDTHWEGTRGFSSGAPVAMASVS